MALVNITDSGVVTGAITILGLVVKGFFEDRANKRRYAALSGKIDENTAENREQIKVSNHVNEKLESTTATAAAANSIAADGLAGIRRDVNELGTKVDFYTGVTEELATLVRSNTRKLDAVIVGSGARGD